MSAGEFKNCKYGMTKGGGVALVRVQPETETLVLASETNTEVSGPVTYPYKVRVSGGKQEIGCRTRLVGIKFQEGQTPSGYKVGGIIYLPWFDPDTFGNIVEGSSGTYEVNGTDVPVTCTGTIAEAGR